MLPSRRLALAIVLPAFLAFGCEREGEVERPGIVEDTAQTATDDVVTATSGTIVETPTRTTATTATVTVAPTTTQPTPTAPPAGTQQQARPRPDVMPESAAAARRQEPPTSARPEATPEPAPTLPAPAVLDREPQPAPAPADDDGRQAFLALNCNACHAVSSAGIEGKRAVGPDLAGVSGRRQNLAQYLRTTHKPNFRGNEGQLEAIVSWLRRR